jgi:hypothetical protein
VPLLPGVLDALPITAGLADRREADHRPVLLIDTARDYSILSLKFTERYWSSPLRRWAARRACRRDGSITVSFLLPGGGTAALDVLMVPECRPSYGAELAVIVDGYLGLDFLYRWLPVMDFVGRELVLFDFS